MISVLSKICCQHFGLNPVLNLFSKSKDSVSPVHVGADMQQCLRIMFLTSADVCVPI